MVCHIWTLSSAQSAQSVSHLRHWEMGKFFTLIQTYCGATTNAQSLEALLQSVAHFRRCNRNGEIIHSDPNIVWGHYTTDAQSLEAQLQPEVKEDGSIRERSCRTPCRRLPGPRICFWWRSCTGPGNLQGEQQHWWEELQDTLQKTASPEDLLLMEKLHRTWQPLIKENSYIGERSFRTPCRRPPGPRICFWWRSCTGPGNL